MARIKLDLDQEAYQRLVELATTERRPITMQAEVIIRRGLGLPLSREIGETIPRKTREVQT